MTQRLYYDDSYTTRFTARVVERTTAGDRPAVILDRTYFYPTGGGQPHDTGLINGVSVVEVFTRETDYAIVHVLADASFGEIVEGSVHWTRRFDHMQQHTGQHILTQSFVELADAKTIGFHLSPNSVTIDLEAANLTAESVEAVEALVNRVVQENRPVTTRIIEPEEAEELGARIRRIPGHLATGGLRVVEVQSFDLTACGGTHVARTGEIGLIKILRLENYKGGTRVEFACGGRALTDYREKHALTADLALGFGSGLREIPYAVSRLKDELKTAQAELKQARAALLKLETPVLLAETPSVDGLRVIRRVYDGRDPADVRALASKLVEQPGTVAILAAAGPKAQVFCARSADLPHDMNPVLQSALASLGARGGGRPDFAQGGGIEVSAAQLEPALQAAEAALVAALARRPE